MNLCNQISEALNVVQSVKGLKKLDVTAVKEQIELLVGEDETGIKQLLNNY